MFTCGTCCLKFLTSDLFVRIVISGTYQNLQIWDLLIELSDLEPAVRIVRYGSCCRNLVSTR